MKSVLYTIATAVALLLSQAALCEDLTGRWEGQFGYPDGRPSVPFRWDIRDDRGLLTGRSVERNTFDRNAGRELTARLDGSNTGERFELVKTYSNGGRVFYSGTISSTQLSGYWEIDGVKGPFQLERPRTFNIDLNQERRSDKPVDINVDAIVDRERRATQEQSTGLPTYEPLIEPDFKCPDGQSTPIYGLCDDDLKNSGLKK